MQHTSNIVRVRVDGCDLVEDGGEFSEGLRLPPHPPFAKCGFSPKRDLMAMEIAHLFCEFIADACRLEKERPGSVEVTESSGSDGFFFQGVKLFDAGAFDLSSDLSAASIARAPT